MNKIHCPPNHPFRPRTSVGGCRVRTHVLVLPLHQYWCPFVPVSVPECRTHTNQAKSAGNSFRDCRNRKSTKQCGTDFSVQNFGHAHHCSRVKAHFKCKFVTHYDTDCQPLRHTFGFPFNCSPKLIINTH